MGLCNNIEWHLKYTFISIFWQFGLMILIAFLMYMTVGIWSLVNLNHTDDITQSSLETTMAQYETNQAYRDGWDSLQTNVRPWVVTPIVVSMSLPANLHTEVVT